jgi:two-component system, OmpR family, response regulator
MKAYPSRSCVARLLIADNDIVLLQALKARLEQSGYIVDTLRDGSSAVQAAGHCPYDLVIIELMLPDVDGLSLIRSLRARPCDVPILIITARHGLSDRIEGLDAGADDYLVKPFQIPELEARIRALLRRGRHDLFGFRVGDVQLAFDGARISASGVTVDLSPSESALLDALLTRLGRVVSKNAIAVRLGRGVNPPSDTAIEICVHRLRRRLDPLGLKIRTLRRLGYLLEPTHGE